VCVVFFFFSSRRRHTRFSRDWSSDVCSSDLTVVLEPCPMNQTSNQPFQLPIQGMTCASCAGRIERALARLAGVNSVQVNLASDSVTLRAPADALPRLVEAVRDAGYQVPVEERELRIEKMTCASCSGRVERALAKLPG